MCKNPLNINTTFFISEGKKKTSVKFVSNLYLINLIRILKNKMFSLSKGNKKEEAPQPKKEEQYNNSLASLAPSSKTENNNNNNVATTLPPPQNSPSATPVEVSNYTKQYANVDDRMPHYSRVVDPIETLNPVTGRSIYYGARPWRCDDRVHDWLQSLVALRWKKSKIAWRNLMDCAYSEFGGQPTCPYETLQRQTVMYYVDRQDHGMVRDYMFEKYPFSTRDFVRVMTDDGTKMRVWRHQRELELEAKQGRVDEIIAVGVLPPKKNKETQK